MSLRITGRPATTVAAAVLLLVLSGCGSDDPINHPWRPGGAGTAAPGPAPASDLSGALSGAGSSAQESAMQAWVAGFQAGNPDVTVAYDPVGSGGGRTQFVEGGVDLAGTDAPLDDDELAGAAARCAPGEVLELPLYVSPIAVVFNVPGIASLNMSPDTVARLFTGEITRWDDPAIAAANPDVDLPDLAVTPVNRSDESGTTENFTEYLAAAAPGSWPYEASGDWPLSGGQSAQGTSGVVQTVTEGHGGVTYADASKAGGLGTVALQVGDEFVPYSPAAAAGLVDTSPRAEGRPPGSLVVELDRTTTAPGVYPLVLVSYTAVCTAYDTAGQAELVAAFVQYVASEAGQQTAAQTAGAAPISEQLRSQVLALVETIG